MKLNIKGLGNGVWQLVTTEGLILMSINNYVGNACYRIQDFRYSTNDTPSDTGDDYSEFESLEDSPEVQRYKRELFNNPVFDKYLTVKTRGDISIYEWQTNDGIVFEGHDKPFDEQTSPLRNPRHIWSYKEARRKLREAKEFWEAFTGEWADAKLANSERLPSGMEMRRRLRKLVERDKDK